MKTIGSVFLFAAIVLFCATAASAVGTGCITSGSEMGTRGDKIFYTDCFAWDNLTPNFDGYLDNGSTPNDRGRLQRAIDTAAKSSTATGKLIFNEDEYYVDGTLTLRSYSVLEGNGPELIKSSGSPSYRLRIMETEENTPLFSIGEGVHDVSLRDLGLVYYWVGGGGDGSDDGGSIAIKAEGSGSGSNSTSIVLDHLRIAFFAKGIYTNSTTTTNGGWQFDNNHLQDTYFELCGTAIHLNAGNGGWQINNIVFASGAGQNGLYIESVGYININFMVGNGTYEDETHAVRLSNEFIKIEAHGFVNISNANGEAYKKNLIISTPSLAKSTPIVLTNNDFQECQYTESGVVKPSVVITGGTVISTGNSFACAGKVARPVIDGPAEVYSTGDSFCFEWSPKCFSASDPFADADRAGWAVKSSQALLRTDAISNPNDTIQDWRKAFVDLTSSYYRQSDGEGGYLYKPFLSFTNSYYSTPGGVPTYLKYRYTIGRNADTGRLQFDGDLNGNNAGWAAGYQFKNGAVQLHKVTASQISSYNIPAGGDSGSMLYCSDCTAGTNPCSTTGGGGGAMAVKIESGNWACK